MKVYCKNNPLNLLICNYESGGFIHQDSLATAYKRICVTYNIRREHGTGPHILRHTWVTYNIMINNVNPVLVARIAGHKNTNETTGTYTHLTEEALRQVNNPINILKRLGSEEKDV